MGAKPSSAVQQSAYLEALDKYIDYDENGNLRKCLLDRHGHRLKDKDGNEKLFVTNLLYIVMILLRGRILLKSCMNSLKHYFVAVPKQAFK